MKHTVKPPSLRDMFSRRPVTATAMVISAIASIVCFLVAVSGALSSGLEASRELLIVGALYYAIALTQYHDIRVCWDDES